MPRAGVGRLRRERGVAAMPPAASIPAIARLRSGRPTCGVLLQ